MIVEQRNNCCAISWEENSYGHWKATQFLAMFVGGAIHQGILLDSFLELGTICRWKNQLEFIYPMTVLNQFIYGILSSTFANLLFANQLGTSMHFFQFGSYFLFFWKIIIFGVCFWTTFSSILISPLALCSGIFPGWPWGTIWGARDKTRSAVYKASILPTVLSVRIQPHPHIRIRFLLLILFQPAGYSSHTQNTDFCHQICGFQLLQI